MNKSSMKIGLIVFAFLALGFGKPDHSQVTAKFKSKTDKKIEFDITTIKNFAVNPIGKWEIRIKKSDDIDFGKNTAVLVDDKKESRRFEVEYVSKKKSGEFLYDAIVFACTKDKTICVRDHHKNLKFRW